MATRLRAVALRRCEVCLMLTGGCLCGRIRFVAPATPRFEVNCHCRICQKVTGSGYTPVAAFAQESVVIEGEIKYYERRGDSGGKVWEGFCPDCGARLTGKAEAMPGLLLLQAGNYDRALAADACKVSMAALASARSSCKRASAIAKPG